MHKKKEGRTEDPTKTEAYRKANENFLKAWEQTDELVEVVLKAHLLVEESIGEALRALTNQPQHIEALRLTFHARAGIVRALSPNTRDDIWELTSAINALRNTLAHRLDQSERPEKLARLRKAFEKAYRKGLSEQPDDAGMVLLSAAFCSSYFQGLAHGTRDSKKVKKGDK